MANSVYIYCFLSLAAAVSVHIIVYVNRQRLGLVKPNFKKISILSSYGIISYLYFVSFSYIAILLGLADWSSAGLFLSVSGIMCLLGLIDDVFGSRDSAGFKGHFKKLFKEGKLTTGALKAIGGGLVGIAVGWYLWRDNPLLWVLCALLIPLSANTMNLMDMRPGRASAVFMFGLIVTCIMAVTRVESWFAISILAACFIFVYPDSEAKVMMGDSGSNMFGAVLGVAISMYCGLKFQITVVILMAGIQFYSEKHSISALIENNSVLRFIDKRLGVR